MASVRHLTALLFLPVFLHSADIQSKVRLPLVFEPDQTSNSQFVSRSQNGLLEVTSLGTTINVRGSQVKMMFKGAAKQTAEPMDKLKSYSNYFIGSDSKAWRTRVPHYSKVRYRNVYAGIDVVYYGNDSRLEYDFVLAPGTSSDTIELAFEGADRVKADANGDLLIEVAGQQIRQAKPIAYQMAPDGSRQIVECAYRLSETDQVQFALARYDRERPLIVDPVLQFSTYLGGSGYDVGVSLASDSTGAIYLAGQSNSGSLPASRGNQPGLGGTSDAIVAKFSPSGETLQWMSYFGGKEPEIANSIGVDAAGNVVITGFTGSNNLPTLNAAQSTHGGGLDAYVAKFNASGSALVYATYLGGKSDDFAIGLAVDAAGAAYATGWTLSSDFPTANSYQSGPSGGGRDIFITKLPASGSPLAYSTYIGGNGDDYGTGIALDPQGSAYVTGGSTSSFLANTATRVTGKQDSFVLKLTPNGQSVDYLAFRGGTLDDLAYSVAVDAAGSAYVSGYTVSPDFPVTAGALQRTFGGVSDLFVYKMKPDGTAADYSTFIGGSSDDLGFGTLRIDAAGTAYLTGWTGSENFPTRNAAQTSFGGGRQDAFILRLAPAGDSLLYSTFLGGSGNENAYGLALDHQSNVVISGWTSSSNFPSATGTLTVGSLENRDVFLARVSADSSVALLGVSPASLRFAARSGQPVPSQTIQLSSTGQPMSFAAGANVPWLTVTASANTTPASLVVTASSATFNGAMTGEITINAPTASNAPIRIPVSLTVEALPAIASINPGAVTRGVQSTPVTITGSGFTASAMVALNGSNVVTSYVNPTTLLATIPSILLPASSSASITVQTSAGTSPAFLLPILSGVPSVSAAGVVNAASHQGGLVSPGLLVTLYGSSIGPEQPVAGVADGSGTFPTLLGETRVLFDGVPAAVTDVRSTQVSAAVPFNLAGKQSVQVEIEYRGQKSAAVSILVSQATPALFTAQATGLGPVAALNEFSSSVTSANPAARGSIVSLYATGLGATMPLSVDGRIATGAIDALPTPSLPVSVTIGGVRAEVLYAGAAPGLMLGIFQVNVRVPAEVAPGDAIPIVLSSGPTASRDGVTIPLR